VQHHECKPVHKQYHSAHLTHSMLPEKPDYSRLWIAKIQQQMGRTGSRLKCLGYVLHSPAAAENRRIRRGR
jgi:hypothetical protein